MTKSAKSMPSRKKVVARRRTGAPAPPAKSKERAPATPVGTKLETLVALLRTRRGASIPDMMEATGWQAHSVRGALAGALKKRGHAITSDKTDGERRYKIAG